MNRRDFVKSIGVFGASTTALTGTAAACTEEEFRIPADDTRYSSADESESYVAAGTFVDGRSWVVTDFETVNREETTGQPDVARVVETTYERGMNPEYLSCQYIVESEVVLPSPESEVQFSDMIGTTLHPFMLLNGVSKDPFQIGGVRATVRMKFEIEFKLSRLIVKFDSMNYYPPYYHPDRTWTQ